MAVATDDLLLITDEVLRINPAGGGAGRVFAFWVRPNGSVREILRKAQICGIKGIHFVARDSLIGAWVFLAILARRPKAFALCPFVQSFG